LPRPREVYEHLLSTRFASATRGPRRTRGAHPAACSTAGTTPLTFPCPDQSGAVGTLINALSFLHSLLLSQLCFHLFSFLFGETNLLAGAFQLPPGFLSLCAFLAVCPLGLAQPIPVHLALPFQGANAIAYLIAVLALNSILVLLVNPELVSLLSTGGLLCGRWECRPGNDE